MGTEGREMDALVESGGTWNTFRIESRTLSAQAPKAEHPFHWCHTLSSNVDQNGARKRSFVTDTVGESNLPRHGLACGVLEVIQS